MIMDRILTLCFTALAAAAMLYVAVRLIESIASTLVLVVAAVSVLLLVGSVARLLWRRRTGRW